MDFKSIKESCLYVKDLEATREFYHNKLGMPLISLVPNKHVFFHCGVSVLLCFIPEDSKLKESPPGHFAYGKQHIAFEVDSGDYDDWRRRILSLGIEIIDDQVWENGHCSFYFEDPDGHVLEVVEEGMWD